MLCCPVEGKPEGERHLEKNVGGMVAVMTSYGLVEDGNVIL